MPIWMRILNGQNYAKMDKAGDAGAGGGAPDLSAEIAALKAQIAELTKKPDPAPAPDDKKKQDDLADQARQKREQDDAKKGELKTLESAVRFETGVKDWHKTNASLLPKSVADILALADKENYDSSIEKSKAIKAGIVSEFFAVQSNLDLLTENQKNSIDEFKKLTKNDKQERINAIYDSIFEPTFEQLKRIEKAKQVSQGTSTASGAEAMYKEKLVKLAMKTYMGVK